MTRMEAELEAMRLNAKAPKGVTYYAYRLIKETFGKTEVEVKWVVRAQ